MQLDLKSILVIIFALIGFISSLVSLYILKSQKIYDNVISFWMRSICGFDCITLTCFIVNFFFEKSQTTKFDFVVNYLQICSLSITIGFRTVFFLFRSFMLIYQRILIFYNIYVSIIVMAVFIVFLCSYHIPVLVNHKPLKEVPSELVTIFRLIFLFLSDVCILFSSIYLIYFLMIQVKPVLLRIEALFEYHLTQEEIQENHQRNLYGSTKRTILWTSAMGIVWVLCNLPFIAINILMLNTTDSNLDVYYYSFNDDMMLVMLFPLSISWLFTIILSQPLRQEMVVKLQLLKFQTLGTFRYISSVVRSGDEN
uniref:GCR134 n=1 Tax=Schmidtea mediterranea TaxID=79327 RepID=A0A193KUE8_SCHMD|nr:GCR134 [Schmidtea mediterranea]